MLKNVRASKENIFYQGYKCLLAYKYQNSKLSIIRKYAYFSVSGLLVNFVVNKPSVEKLLLFSKKHEPLKVQTGICILSEKKPRRKHNADECART